MTSSIAHFSSNADKKLLPFCMLICHRKFRTYLEKITRRSSNFVSWFWDVHFHQTSLIIFGSPELITWLVGWEKLYTAWRYIFSEDNSNSQPVRQRACKNSAYLLSIFMCKHGFCVHLFRCRWSSAAALLFGVSFADLSRQDQWHSVFQVSKGCNWVAEGCERYRRTLGRADEHL